MAALLYRCQHRVAGHRALAVGKSTDGDVLGHPEAGMLRRIEDADSRIIVDGKETVGAVFHRQDGGCHIFSIGTIVADADNRLVNWQSVLQQGILIAIEAVLGDFELHGRTVEGDALATRINQVRHGIEGTHIIIDHHATGIHTSTDAVVEHQGDACVDQFLKVVVILRILRL